MFLVVDPAKNGYPLVFLGEFGAQRYVSIHGGKMIDSRKTGMDPVWKDDALSFFSHRHRECGPDCCITGDSCLTDTVAY